jgi:hypothetical protein
MYVLDRRKGPWIPVGGREGKRVVFDSTSVRPYIRAPLIQKGNPNPEKGTQKTKPGKGPRYPTVGLWLVYRR